MNSKTGSKTIKCHIPPLNTKGKEYTNIDANLGKTCMVKIMSSSIPNKRSFSYPKSKQHEQLFLHIFCKKKWSANGQRFLT